MLLLFLSFILFPSTRLCVLRDSAQGWRGPMGWAGCACSYKTWEGTWDAAVFVHLWLVVTYLLPGGLGSGFCVFLGMLPACKGIKDQ